jgi:integrase
MLVPKTEAEKEVLAIFQATENLKHKTIMMLIYSAGLRLGELLKLRVDDLHMDNGQLFIKSGKGKKDRTAILAENIRSLIHKYLREYKPDYWLFEGPLKEPYSARSVQVILRRAVEKAKAYPFATVHTLRDSFATHLLERGTDIRSRSFGTRSFGVCLGKNESPDSYWDLPMTCPATAGAQEKAVSRLRALWIKWTSVICEIGAIMRIRSSYKQAK